MEMSSYSVGVRASFKVLSLASTVFEAMFANRWISDKNPSKAEPATVILPDDHVEKLVLGCGNWRSRGRTKKEATKNNSQNHSSALQSGRNLGIYKQASSVIVQLTLITLGRILPHIECLMKMQLSPSCPVWKLSTSAQWRDFAKCYTFSAMIRNVRAASPKFATSMTSEEPWCIGVMPG